MKLTLADLKPSDAEFKLEMYPGKIFVLKRLSLDVNIWLEKNFTPEQIKDIFTHQKLGEMSRIAYYLLKDKHAVFPKLKNFREAIVTHDDRVELISAMIKTVGVAQPLIDELQKQEGEKKKVRSRSTGQKSTT